VGRSSQPSVLDHIRDGQNVDDGRLMASINITVIYIYIFIFMSIYSYCMFMYLHRASWHSSANLTEVFPCFLLSCKANARVRLTKTGHGLHSFKMFVLFYIYIVCSVSFCVLVVCKCELYYCHRVSTRLQLTNLSYHLCAASKRSIVLRLTAFLDQPASSKKPSRI
jgi:hypothetical protein